MPSVLWVGANMPKVGEKDPGKLEQDTGQKAAATSVRKQLLLSRFANCSHIFVLKYTIPEPSFLGCLSKTKICQNSVKIPGILMKRSSL